MDHRDWRAPIALPADAPVAQAVLHLFVAEILGREVGRDRTHRSLVAEAVVGAGVDAHAALLVGVPVLPRVGGEGLAIDRDHLRDRQLILLRKGEVALVVRGHAHHRAFSIGHQHVVADPDFNLCAGQRMGDVKAGGQALLFHRRHVGFHHRALLALLDERYEGRLVLRQALGQRVFGGDGDEADAHDRVGARGVDAQQLVLSVDLIGEAEVDALALADPVLLDQAQALAPARQLVQRGVEQLLGVLGDVEVVAGDLASSPPARRSASRGRRSPARWRARSGPPDPS